MEKASLKSGAVYFSVALFIMIICCAQYGDAITCFVCNSHTEPDCFSAPNKNANYTMQCDPEDTVCRKVHQWIEGDQSGMGPDERVVRSCGRNETADRKDKMCIHVTGLDNREDQCFCTTDLCNSAPAVIGKIETGTLLALLVVCASLLRD